MLTAIVVPVDETAESERALPAAAALARRTGASVELVTVDSPHVEPGEMETYQERLAREQLAGIPWEGTVDLTEGGVADAILARSDRPGTLLCISTKARGALGEALLGSIGDRVVELAGGPVLLVGPDVELEGGALDAWLAGPVVVMLEGTPDDGRTAEAAVTWATEVGRPLVLVNVLAPADVARRDERRHELEALAATARNDGCTVTTLLVEETDVGQATLRLQHRHGGSLVLGTHRRGPLQRLVHGSDALWITHRCPVPVLLAGGSAHVRA